MVSSTRLTKRSSGLQRAAGRRLSQRHLAERKRGSSGGCRRTRLLQKDSVSSTRTASPLEGQRLLQKDSVSSRDL
ncbi:hypothetical protein EYF80_044807 [Liparis tanakae]|uniref:Uncharacterized protein n=1 Tax=Liparis tanakae TaxID=230148 RepID=A0A4Z2FXE3_9TELE|nr:hypothetical protein EYF80_044807 [Liparis tanakae]